MDVWIRGVDWAGESIGWSHTSRRRVRLSHILITHSLTLSHQPTVLITGCIFSSVALFRNTIGVGGFVFNVAGSVLFTGCVFNSNGAFYQSSGIGYLSFNSAGLSIFTVC